eukprot:4540933-Amphidinium_carterae.2
MRCGIDKKLTRWRLGFRALALGDDVVGFLHNLDRLLGGTSKPMHLLVEEKEYEHRNWAAGLAEGEENEWEGKDEHFLGAGDDMISENLAQHILVTMGLGGKNGGGYTKHRAQIHQHKLARGFLSSMSAPKGKPKGTQPKGKRRDRSPQARIAPPVVHAVDKWGTGQGHVSSHRLLYPQMTVARGGRR